VVFHHPNTSAGIVALRVRKPRRSLSARTGRLAACQSQRHFAPSARLCCQVSAVHCVGHPLPCTGPVPVLLFSNRRVHHLGHARSPCTCSLRHLSIPSQGRRCAPPLSRQRCRCLRFGPRMRPNPSFEPTHYGRLCKPGLRYAVHFLSPGLQSLPPWSAQLQR
jgi:hypothetical protein